MIKALQNEKKEPNVAYSGRGGAGNMYDPRQLTQTGRLNTSQNIETERHGSCRNDPDMRMRGRGGAGNYFLTTQAEQVERLGSKEQIKAPEPVSQIEQDVERGLTKLQPAHLSPKK